MADVLPRLLSFPRRSDTTHAVSDEEYDEQARNFVAYLKECLPNKTDEVSGGILEVSFWPIHFVHGVTFKCSRSDFENKHM